MVDVTPARPIGAMLNGPTLSSQGAERAPDRVLGIGADTVSPDKRSPFLDAKAKPVVAARSGTAMIALWPANAPRLASPVSTATAPEIAQRATWRY